MNQQGKDINFASKGSHIILESPSINKTIATLFVCVSAFFFVIAAPPYCWKISSVPRKQLQSR